MERIKQAIENAKKSDAEDSVNSDQTHAPGKRTKKPRSVQFHQDLRSTIKSVIAIVFIFAASILWLRLDFMNRLELGASEYIHDGIEQSRAEAKKRLLEKEKFEKLILDNFNHCQSTAEKMKESYDRLIQKTADKSIIYHLNLIQKPEHRKMEIFVVPLSVTDEAAKIFNNAKAECQNIYNVQLKNGK